MGLYLIEASRVIFGFQKACDRESQDTRKQWGGSLLLPFSYQLPLFGGPD